MRRIVICCDATWASAVLHHRYSHVARISNVILPVDEEGNPQLIYYDSGVGTNGVLDNLVGGMTGTGIDEKIKMAYLFLINNYVEGDEIFLFGYSRGAYVVRTLIDLITTKGVLKKESAHQLDTLYNAYRNKNDGPWDEFCYQTKIKIKFLGVFDLVFGDGLPSANKGVPDQRYALLTPRRISESVEYAYHALAADETAWDCYPYLWVVNSSHTVTEQQWFPGRHRDIGGLDPSSFFSKAGLSHCSLKWMLEKAKACGLALDEALFQTIKVDAMGNLSQLTWTDTFLNFTLGTFVPHVCDSSPTLNNAHSYIPREYQSRFLGRGNNYRPAVACQFSHVMLSDALKQKMKGDSSYRPSGIPQALANNVLLTMKDAKQEEIFLKTNSHRGVNTKCHFKKRIVICCDGTWYSALTSEPRSNIAKIAHIVMPLDSHVTQVTYYDSGVGTKGLIDPLTGGVTGAGIDEKIKMAYLFIVNNFIPGDELFLFGFSRGAYTVRSLAGFIKLRGVIEKKSAEDKLHSEYEDYRAGRPTNAVGRKIKIKFLGVFDTVCALGLRSKFFMPSQRYAFHDVKLGEHVENACQALALDERRADYSPVIWESSSSTYSEQRWFTGTHSDIGGGYREDGLSNIPLHWMLIQAHSCNLAINLHLFEKMKQLVDPSSPLHDSINDSSLSCLMRIYYRLGQIVRQVNPQGDSKDKISIAPEVKKRMELNASYRPLNLKAINGYGHFFYKNNNNNKRLVKDLPNNSMQLRASF